MSDFTTEATFTGKSGATVIIHRFGIDDYGAWWTDEAHLDDDTYGYSVRGSLKDIIAELKDEL